MEAVIQLRADLAALMEGETSRAWPDHLTHMKRELDDRLARHGASLRPMHPGTQDAELMRYYTLSADTDSVGNDSAAKQSEADSVLLTLRSLEAVTAAYVKPDVEPA